MIIQNTSIFVRGQVWYWDDPIYHKKDYGLSVENGEQTIRYSRYCIIAQNSNTLSNNSILVIPCSSKYNTPHDVYLQLAHPCITSETYAKVASVFPVSPKSLIRYICTLGTNEMNQIDTKLRNLILPVDIDNCNDYNIQNSIEEKSVSEIANNGEVINSIEDINREELNVSIEEHPDSKRMKRKIYTIDERIDFIKMYLSDGINTAAEKYNMHIPNAYNLLSRSKRILGLNEYNDIFTYNKESIIDEQVEEINDEIIIPNLYDSTTPLPITIDADKAISIISKKIVITLKELKIFESTSDILLTNNRSFKEKRETWYSRMSLCVYYSLIGFLGIRVNSNMVSIPPILHESRYLETWHYLDKISHDEEISKEKDGINMTKLYRNKYGLKGINREWGFDLSREISDKFSTDECNIQDIQNICDTIITHYCG